METGFVRPSSVPKGVRSRFSTFRIEDIPDNRRDDAIEHFINNFFRDEPLSSVFREIRPYTNEDIRTFLSHALNDNISLIAVDESRNDEIAGATILRVVSRCAPNKHVAVDSKLKSMDKLFNFLHFCYDGLDTFTYESGSSKIVVDHVLEPMGLSVAREYRGKGIGDAIIKARHELAAEVGIGATQGIYTSIYSQPIISQQPGMYLMKEIMYSDYLVDGKAIFAKLNPPHPSAKVIGGLIPKDMA